MPLAVSDQSRGGSELGGSSPECRILGPLVLCNPGAGRQNLGVGVVQAGPFPEETGQIT